jgi:hypothetical protein
MKKEKLNEKLYYIHLENAKEWDNLWNCIQTAIEYKLQAMSEILYKKLNKKIRQIMSNI